jgi:hypothetical protein
MKRRRRKEGVIKVKRTRGAMMMTRELCCMTKSEDEDNNRSRVLWCEYREPCMCIVNGNIEEKEQRAYMQR